MVLQAGDRDTAGFGHVAIAGRTVATEDHHLGSGIQDVAPVVARRAAPSRRRRHGRHVAEDRPGSLIPATPPQSRGAPPTTPTKTNPPHRPPAPTRPGPPRG